MKKFGSLLILLALVACSSNKKPEVSEEISMPEPEIRTDNLICPQVAILRQADEEFDYGGEKPDVTQFVAKASLKQIKGDCAYRKDEDDPTGIDISFKVRVSAMKGPRLGGNQISFPYFIAVVDPSDAVLQRQVLTAQFRFTGDSKVAEIEEPLHVFIPVSAKNLITGPSYRVLIGFTKSSR
ncbi:MAG: hypothetical protein WC521_00405 [Bdellovibrionales bacterium]